MSRAKVDLDRFGNRIASALETLLEPLVAGSRGSFAPLPSTITIVQHDWSRYAVYTPFTVAAPILPLSSSNATPCLDRLQTNDYSLGRGKKTKAKLTEPRTTLQGPPDGESGQHDFATAIQRLLSSISSFSSPKAHVVDLAPLVYRLSWYLGYRRVDIARGRKNTSRITECRHISSMPCDQSCHATHQPLTR